MTKMSYVMKDRICSCGWELFVLLSWNLLKMAIEIIYQLISFEKQSGKRHIVTAKSLHVVSINALSKCLTSNVKKYFDGA